MDLLFYKKNEQGEVEFVEPAVVREQVTDMRRKRDLERAVPKTYSHDA